MAISLYRLMVERIGREYERTRAKKLFRNFLDVSATIVVDEERLQVILDKRAHNPYLVPLGLVDTSIPMTWYGNMELMISFA
jgi:hypothetical protein